VYSSKLRIVAIVLCAAGAALLGSAPGTTAAAGNEPDRPRPAGKDTEAPRDNLLGTWSVTSVEMHGKEAPGAAAFIKGEWAVTADTFKFKLGNDAVTWTYTRDVAKRPGEIELTATSGPEKGQTLKGIYKVEGDRLRMCFGKERPTAFATGPDQESVLMLFRREPPDKRADLPEKK
jgi:uncharacterized protein (TIGR03067 family)